MAAHRLGAWTEVVQAPPGPGSQGLQGTLLFSFFLFLPVAGFNCKEQ